MKEALLALAGWVEQVEREGAAELQAAVEGVVTLREEALERHVVAVKELMEQALNPVSLTPATSGDAEA